MIKTLEGFRVSDVLSANFLAADVDTFDNGTIVFRTRIPAGTVIDHIRISNGDLDAGGTIAADVGHTGWKDPDGNTVAAVGDYFFDGVTTILTGAGKSIIEYGNDSAGEPPLFVTGDTEIQVVAKGAATTGQDGDVVVIISGTSVGLETVAVV